MQILQEKIIPKIFIAFFWEHNVFLAVNSQMYGK